MTDSPHPLAASDIQPLPAPPAERNPPDAALVPVRPRSDGWTPDKQHAFIEHLANGVCVKSACAAVDMSEASIYKLRQRPDAVALRTAWVAALRARLDQVTTRVVDRAVDGDLRQRWYKGEMVGEERVFSDRLQIWVATHGIAMLDRAEARRERDLELDDRPGLLASPEREIPHQYRVWQDRESGHWMTNAPPPPEFNGWEEGEPHQAEYQRVLCDAEEEAWLARPEIAGAVDKGEAARQALFGPGS